MDCICRVCLRRHIAGAFRVGAPWPGQDGPRKANNSPRRWGNASFNYGRGRLALLSITFLTEIFQLCSFRLTVATT
jgi:hypothetical protein